MEGCILAEDNADSDCVLCEEDFLLVNASCFPLVEHCSLHDENTVRCLECETDFALNNDFLCELAIPDPFCHRFEGVNCVSCSKGYYFNQDRKCALIDPLCQDFNYETKSCEVCYPGYEVIKGYCSEFILPLDPNCHKFVANQCIECSQGFVFDTSESICVTFDPFCKIIDRVSH